MVAVEGASMSDKPRLPVLTAYEVEQLRNFLASYKMPSDTSSRCLLDLVVIEVRRLQAENTEMRADFQALVDALAKKELEAETAKQAYDYPSELARQQALAEAAASAGRALYNARTGYVGTPLVPGAFIGVSPNRGGALGDSTTAGIGSAPAAKCEPPKSGASFGPQLWADHIWKGKP
jgi:hypothetical protein